MGIHPRQNSNLLFFNPNLQFKHSFLQFKLAIIELKHSIWQFFHLNRLFKRSVRQFTGWSIQFCNLTDQFINSNIQFGDANIQFRNGNISFIYCYIRLAVQTLKHSDSIQTVQFGHLAISAFFGVRVRERAPGLSRSLCCVSLLINTFIYSGITESRQTL